MAKGAEIWMPIFIGDHLAETSDFEAVEQGAYVLLLMRLWQSDGLLSDNDHQLARIARVSPGQWKKIKPMVMRLFVLKDGFYSHNRMDVEIQKARDNVEKRRRAGIASGISRREHMFNTRSTDEPTHVEPRAGSGGGEGDAAGKKNTTRDSFSDWDSYDEQEPF